MIFQWIPIIAKLVRNMTFQYFCTRLTSITHVKSVRHYPEWSHLFDYPEWSHLFWPDYWPLCLHQMVCSWILFTISVLTFSPWSQFEHLFSSMFTLRSSYLHTHQLHLSTLASWSMAFHELFTDCQLYAIVDQIARCRPVSAIRSLDNLKQYRYLGWGFFHMNLNVDLSCRQIQEDITCLVVYVFFHNCRSFGLASVFFSWPKPSGFPSGQPLRPFWVCSGENKISFIRTMLFLLFRTDEAHFAFWLYQWTWMKHWLQSSFQSQYCLGKLHCDTDFSHHSTEEVYQCRSNFNSHVSCILTILCGNSIWA